MAINPSLRSRVPILKAFILHLLRRGALGSIRIRKTEQKKPINPKTRSKLRIKPKTAYTTNKPETLYVTSQFTHLSKQQSIIKPDRPSIPRSCSKEKVSGWTFYRGGARLCKPTDLRTCTDYILYETLSSLYWHVFPTTE